jgi:hypothetical protein
VAGGGVAAEVLLKVTHRIPIVFVIVPDPVGSGFVESLSQPGGNATGFMMFEYNLCGKWLELLKEIAPSVTHASNRGSQCQFDHRSSRTLQAASDLHSTALCNCRWIDLLWAEFSGPIPTRG